MACKDAEIFEKDHVLKLEAARRPFKKLLKYRSCRSAETILQALIRFDAIMTDTIDSFSSIVQSSQLSDRSLLQFNDADANVGAYFVINYNKGSTILQHSLRKIKHLLLTVASYLLTSCFQIFCVNCTDTFSSTLLETSVLRSGS